LKLFKGSSAKETLKAIYVGSCPNCGGEEEDGRLLEGLPCTVCFPFKEDPCRLREKLSSRFEAYCRFKDKVREFEREN